MEGWIIEALYCKTFDAGLHLILFDAHADTTLLHKQTARRKREGEQCGIVL